MIPPAATQEDLSRHGESILEGVNQMQRDQLLHMERMVANGFEAGMRNILADKTMVDNFWRAGFDRFAEHGSDSASKWVGRRLLTAAMFALLGFTLTYLVKTGAFK